MTNYELTPMIDQDSQRRARSSQEVRGAASHEDGSDLGAGRSGDRQDSSTGPSRTQIEAELSGCRGRAYVAAYQVMRSTEDAHECVQEASVKALAAWQRFDSTLPFYPWFYRILKNVCLDRLARQRTRTRGAETLRREAPPAPTAEGALLQQERERAVVTALEKLPDNQREILGLRHYQDLSYEEMADVLNCPVGTIMSRLYRARVALRTQMRRDYPDLLKAKLERSGR